MKFAMTIALAMLAAGCSHSPPAIPRDEIAHQSDLTDGLRQIVHLIGTYDVGRPSARNECRVEVLARISTATIEYQRAVDTEGGLSGEGNIPAGPVILTPSIGGTRGRVQTVKESYTLDFQPEQTKPHRQLGEPFNGTAVDAVTLKSARTLRTEIEGQISQILAGRHPRPCIEPKTLMISASTQLQRKLNGGFSINIIVAKVGGTVATTTTDTQSVTLTIQLGGSAAIM